jgi:hypothetical protein
MHLSQNCSRRHPLPPLLDAPHGNPRNELAGVLDTNAASCTRYSMPNPAFSRRTSSSQNRWRPPTYSPACEGRQGRLIAMHSEGPVLFPSRPDPADS